MEENEKLQNEKLQEESEEQKKEQEKQGKTVLDAFFERKAEEGQMVAKRGYRVNHQEV
jgi:hypothetical protein